MVNPEEKSPEYIVLDLNGFYINSVEIQKGDRITVDTLVECTDNPNYFKVKVG